LGDIIISALYLNLATEIIRLRDAFFACSWRGMGYNGGDVIIALNVSIYGSLYPLKQ
jgi:hypothetical protein